MQSGRGVEYEYQFPKYNKTLLNKFIKKNNFKKIHNKTKYVVTYFYAPNKSEFYRIRKEFDSITLTKKILSICV